MTAGSRPNPQTPPGFERRSPKPTLHPRRVFGGQKISWKVDETPPHWSAQRWLRLAEDNAPGEHYTEGLEYARSGQTRGLELAPGLIESRVQGRMPRAYDVQIRLPVFEHADWEKVLDAMVLEARYAASLLAGDMPAGIEDVFIPAGLRLFPAAASDLGLKCSCSLPGPWCKHVCCTMALVAERLQQDPFVIFQLRGTDREDLLERLRQRLAVAGMGRSAADTQPMLRPFIPGVSDVAIPSLEACADDFWAEPQGLESLDMPLEPPVVSQPLLRRLGPSPFPNAKFPLVGLLATCYDVISEAVQRSEEEGAGGTANGEDAAPEDVDG